MRAFIGVVGEHKDRSDFRAVPRSDNGEAYRDRGMLGSYVANNGEPWPVPEDVHYEAGFGASVRDLERGFCKPRVTEDPAYDAKSYYDRSTEPSDPEVWRDELEFRNRNRRSDGFLTRPRVPTERG